MKTPVVRLDLTRLDGAKASFDLEYSKMRELIGRLGALLEEASAGQIDPRRQGEEIAAFKGAYPRAVEATLEALRRFTAECSRTGEQLGRLGQTAARGAAAVGSLASSRPPAGRPH